jgi:hypothetical protein
MYNPSREQVRQFLIESWRKRRDALPASAIEIMAGDIIAIHPEYHALLDASEDAIGKDWLPDEGSTNPFLHLSLHLAIEEQLSINQPPGIVPLFEQLLQRRGDRHQALHAVLDSLAETLWRSQRDNAPLDGEAYLERLRQAIA